MKNQRGNHWRPTIAQRKKGLDDAFALESLTIRSDLEGKTYKDLDAKDQNMIKKFVFRCAAIPSSWAMSDYIEFFKRIQGGGTPMSDHELRRAIARGPFTELLDSLATENYVLNALRGFDLQTDQVQQLLLRYFGLVDDEKGFGKPSLVQHGLEIMKKKNKEMEQWTAQDSLRRTEALDTPLKEALDTITCVFRDNEPFRAVAPLRKNGVDQHPKKVWINSKKLSNAFGTALSWPFQSWTRINTERFEATR